MKDSYHYLGKIVKLPAAGKADRNKKINKSNPVSAITCILILKRKQSLPTQILKINYKKNIDWCELLIQNYIPA